MAHFGSVCIASLFNMVRGDRICQEGRDRPSKRKSDRPWHCLESGKGDRTLKKVIAPNMAYNPEERSLPTFSTAWKSDRP